MGEWVGRERGGDARVGREREAAGRRGEECLGGWSFGYKGKTFTTILSVIFVMPRGGRVESEARGCWRPRASQGTAGRVGSGL